MTQDVHHKFSSHLCAKCGGPAPGWKCPECGATPGAFDARHFISCPHGGKLEAQCQRCSEAESRCTCV